MIQLQLFARYRETLGVEHEQIPWRDDFTDLRSLRDALVQRGEAWQVLDETELMCARNQTMCNLDERLEDGDEIAFFPPVTGG
ncbi:MoaD/ThiS family protein [Halopseudomonas sp.]|jgi:molybdopterin synthase sulfur carrier subunit|uniref:MoaD/ThiS family protein n=1 Tax=Halopseudomonas sp. TaxID=2901191 RepID=UPI0039E628CC